MPECESSDGEKMYNAKQMFRLALAMALDKGPVMIRAKGKNVAAYALSKEELEGLYDDHSFSTDRSTWLNHITKWPKYGALVPEDLKERTGNWYVLFNYIDIDNFTRLKMFAEDHECFRYPEFAEGVTV